MAAETEVAIFETLISRGWRFRDSDEIRSLIRSLAASPASSSSSPSPTPSPALAAGSIESELLNMDLRFFGGKSLPDSASLKKSPHLQGPIVLQITSVRDIYQSTIDASLRNSQRQRRLLRFGLTDGHSEICAIEYAPIPSITEELIPGTKVRLENKVPIHYGILCLSPKTVTVMGGLVQSLHEEWQMSQKYAGFSRLSLRLSGNDNGIGPPPFEKLQIEACASKSIQKQRFSDSTVTEAKASRGPHVADNRACFKDRSGDERIDSEQKQSATSGAEDRLEDRPKEVSEAVPVQNQAASQKLLQKMNQSSTLEGKHVKGHKHRGKNKQEDAQVFTLEEWERRNSVDPKSSFAGGFHDISRDEEIARQLQEQLDLEADHGMAGSSEAETIRMNMFSFRGAGETNDGGSGFRGRGRGRRGRGRGRRFG